MDIKDLAAIATLISIIATLIQAVRKQKIPIIITSWGVWTSSFLMVVFAALTLWLWTAPSPDTSRYGFESGTMGWVPQMYVTDQGVIDVVQSDEKAKFGRYSLKLTADLEGGHPNRSKGEAYVEIATQSLDNKPITVWVYVPKGALGDPQKPNGVQIFVKDGKYKAEYGTWWNITSAKVDGWQLVTLSPSKVAPPDGYIEPGFDPTQIRAVGVKVAIGDGSTAKFRGPIYVDAVDWPK